MSGVETLPIRADIFIPENKVSCWVSEKGVSNDKFKKQEDLRGEWVVEGYTLDKKKASSEVWIFRDDDELGISRRVLENNPLQGTWGYAPSVDPRQARPQDIWFFPPKSAKCKIPPSSQEYNHIGTWVKPTFKRDFSQLGSNSSGFLNVSGDIKIAKGEKHSVGGRWNMLGFNDDVVRGKTKKKKDIDGDKKGPWEIFVKKPSGSRFPIFVIPGNKIAQCKTKICSEKGIPVEEQRLSFNGVPLKDEKTVVGSGIRNGDTIDLGPMIIYVRKKGKKFTFQTSPDELVENVKKMVEKEEGTPANEQRLYFENKKLANGKPLVHFNIKHKSTLDLGAMNIYVQPLGKVPKIELDVEPTDTLESVKVKVKNRTQIPVAEQRLYFKEKEMLDDSKRLERYRVQHLDTLFMRAEDIATNNCGDSIVQKKPMVIFVIKDWNSYKFKLRVEPTNTIIDIKKMIEVAENIPVNQQRLTFKNKSVYNPKTLEQSKIVNKSILHLGEPKKLNSQHPRIEKKPQVEVRTPEGRSFYFDFDPENDKFNDVKRKIAEAVEIPIKDLNLLDSSDDIVPDNYMPSNGTVLDVAPQIEVALPDKSKVKLSMLPKNTIDDLKDMIEEKYGTPKANQRIFFFDDIGDEFDNSTPIKKMGIKPGSVLEMRPIPEDVNITVRSPDGRSFHYSFDPESDTVDSIKRKIAKDIGVPVKELPPLCLNDEELDDGYCPSKNDILSIKPYEVTVELPDRKRVVLSTLPTKTIGEIKDMVEEKTGVKKSNQRVFFFDNAGEEIGDDLSLLKAKIQSGTPLKIIERKEPKEITIKGPTGRMFQFIIDPDEPVKTIKKRISEKIGIPLGGFKLDGKVWTDIDEEVALDDAGFTVRNGGILEVDAPEVEIALPNSKKIKLKIFPTMTIRDVKKIIKEEAPELSTKDKNQRMFFLDSIAELDDDTPFEKLKFEQGQIIEMRSMIIYVQDWNGDKFELDVETNWFLDDIKELICGLTNVSPEQQNISFNGEPVNDQLQLMKQGIVHNSTLILEPMSIRVKVPSKKKTVQFAVKPTDNIGKIKRKAMKKGKLNETHSIDDCCIVSGGQELCDNEAIEKFDIQHDDLLTLEEFALRIMHWSGEIIALDGLKRRDDIVSLKEKIYLMENIPTDEQKLSLHGRRLEDTETLEKLEHRAILVLEPLGRGADTLGAEKKTMKLLKSKKFKSREDNEIMPVMPDWKRRIFFFDSDVEFNAYVDLFIMHWEGEKFMLNKILLTNLVSEVKNKIFNLKGIKKNKQKLKFNGKLLQDRKTLVEQSVGHRDILILESPAVNLIANPRVERLSSTFGMLPTKLLQNITITVKHWNGDTLSLSPAPNDYIDDVKDSICDKLKTPVEQLRLSFQGQPTREDMNLLEQNIVDGSILTLEPMQIFLQLPEKRKSVLINIELDQTVSDIKKNIAQMIKTDFKLLCIMFGGEELDSAKTISACGIDHEDELRVEIFEIKILHSPSGEIFVLKGLGPTSTIYDVKKNVFESKSIPIEQQVLSLKGRVRHDAVRLKDQGVKHRSVLILDPVEEKAASSMKEKVSLTMFKTPANGDKKKIATGSGLKRDDSSPTEISRCSRSEGIKNTKEKNCKAKKCLKKKKTIKQ